MKRYTPIFLIALALSILISCEGKFEPTGNLGPEAVTLQFPDANTICQEGEFLNAGEITIPFRWNSSTDASSYRLEVSNQTSNQTEVLEVPTTTTEVMETTLALAPGTLYSWAVYALKDNLETKSDERSFYSRGEVFNSYVPFPATITITDAGNGSVTIAWQSTDVENDIVGYDVYLATENPPALVLENTSDVSFQDTLTQGMTYYVEVVTKDTTGNSSTAKTSFVVE